MANSVLSSFKKQEASQERSLTDDDVGLTTTQRLKLASIKNNAAVRAEFYQAMADSAEQGFPQLDVLRNLKSSLSKSDAIYILVNQIENRVRGLTASASGASHRSLGTELVGLMPNIEVSMIAAGESSGQIAMGWRNAADYAMHQEQMHKSMKKAMTKPVIYLAAFIGLLLYFSYLILPKFAQSKPREQWPDISLFVGSVADNALPITGGIIGGLVFFVILYKWLSDHWIGESRAAADAMLPMSLASSSSGAGFMLSLASFMGSGISFNEAIQAIKKSSKPYMGWQIESIENDLRQGVRPENALIKRSFIHKDAHWRIALYASASSKNLASAYTRIAHAMLDANEKKQNLAFNLIQGLVLIFLFVSIILILVGIAGIVTAGVDIL